MKKALIKIPVLGRIILFFYRIAVSYKYILTILSNYFRWLVFSKETTNYVYDLEEKNKIYLAALLSSITGKSINEIIVYIEEIESDDQLQKHIADKILKSSESIKTDNNIKFGRRIGWYALVRILKPKVVVETGIDKGLGSCVLAAALMRNKDEGSDGYYYGIDINPAAGFMFDGNYKNFGEIIYGDAIESLKKFNKEIDLFINDSDHSEDYEYNEYLTISNMLSERAVILGDNSHYSDKLYKYSKNNGREFLFFKEQPLKHWYPGAGIGISFKK